MNSITGILPMLYAKDYKCCSVGCDKQAVVFVGLSDPDAETYPKCEFHKVVWKHELSLRLFCGHYMSEAEICSTAEDMAEKERNNGEGKNAKATV